MLFRSKNEDNLLIFPVGSWKGVYTSFELHEAEKRGYKINIIKGVFYNGMGKIFSEFVAKYYKFKQSSIGAKKTIAKLFLNSAYGKFGQRRTFDTLFTEEEALNNSKINIHDLRILNKDLYIGEKTDYSDRRINPVYAVFVTAYARHVLYEQLEKHEEIGRASCRERV